MNHFAADVARMRVRPILFSFLFVLAGCSSCDDDSGGPVDGDAGGDARTDAVVIPQGCGNGTISGAEACDDGNNDGDDGCAADCSAIDPRYLCPTAGQPCIRVVTCGNSRIEGAETCDDGNTASGDGCDANCIKQDGWTCPQVGASCVATDCGDGIVAGFEACDDGNTTSGDGCSSSCVLEEGHHCPNPAGGSCAETTTCGDGLVQGTEQCDDGEGTPQPYDGCDTNCKWEPDCDGGVCTGHIGDGIVIPGSTPAEQCDDGNVLPGDGCSPTGQIEPGFTCTLAPLPAPNSITLPRIVRDFRTCVGASSNSCTYESGSTFRTAPNHPDFQPNGDELRGFVADRIETYTVAGRTFKRPALGVNGQFDSNPWSSNESLPHSAASFAQWYTDDASVNRRVLGTFTLPRDTNNNGVYQFPAAPATSGPDYFPLDSAGWRAPGTQNMEPTRTNGHNFHFTTEIHYWFTYEGNERLRFVGDDDLFVFVDGNLCLDIGGQHSAQTGIMNFSNPGEDGTQSNLVMSCKTKLDAARNALRTSTGIANLNPVFEMIIFNAERHTTESNFLLQLGNFVKSRSACTSFCGDGTRASNESCDLGGSNSDSGYGGCTTSCTFQPFCGDGIINGAELCDDGLNLGGDASACAPGCMSMGAICGDGVVQISNGEACDDGNQIDNDFCTNQCTFRVE